MSTFSKTFWNTISFSMILTIFHDFPWLLFMNFNPEFTLIFTFFLTGFFHPFSPWLSPDTPDFHVSGHPAVCTGQWVKYFKLGICYQNDLIRETTVQLKYISWSTALLKDLLFRNKLNSFKSACIMCGI